MNPGFGPPWKMRCLPSKSFKMLLQETCLLFKACAWSFSFPFWFLLQTLVHMGLKEYCHHSKLCGGLIFKVFLFSVLKLRSGLKYTCDLLCFSTIICSGCWFIGFVKVLFRNVFLSKFSWLCLSGLFTFLKAKSWNSLFKSKSSR